MPSTYLTPFHHLQVLYPSLRNNHGLDHIGRDPDDLVPILGADHDVPADSHLKSGCLVLQSPDEIAEMMHRNYQMEAGRLMTRQQIPAKKQ